MFAFLPRFDGDTLEFDSDSDLVFQLCSAPVRHSPRSLSEGDVQCMRYESSSDVWVDDAVRPFADVQPHLLCEVPWMERGRLSASTLATVKVLAMVRASTWIVAASGGTMVHGTVTGVFPEITILSAKGVVLKVTADDVLLTFATPTMEGLGHDVVSALETEVAVRRREGLVRHQPVIMPRPSHRWDPRVAVACCQRAKAIPSCSGKRVFRNLVLAVLCLIPFVMTSPQTVPDAVSLPTSDRVPTGTEKSLLPEGWTKAKDKDGNTVAPTPSIMSPPLSALTKATLTESCDAADMLPFYILARPESDAVVNQTLVNANSTSSYCALLGVMNPNCLEQSLNAAMRRHPCRVMDIYQSSMVFVETIFIAHMYSGTYHQARQRYNDHLSTWLEIIDSTPHYRKNVFRYFMYYPNWRRPSPHLIKAKTMSHKKNAIFPTLNILSSNVGIGVEKQNPCSAKCEAAARNGMKALLRCYKVSCGTVWQGLDVPPTFRLRAKRHVSVPFYEPRCSDIRPLPDANRTTYIHMSGRWGGHIGRVRIRRSFQRTWDMRGDGPLMRGVRGRGILWGNSSHVIDDMCRSVFCVETQGDSLNTRRLTDAVLCGCIPVIACDNCVYPYVGLLNDLRDFTVRIADHDLGNIVDIVAQVGEENILRLQEGVKRVRNIFASPDCPGSTMVDQIVREMAFRIRGLENGTTFTDYRQAPIN